MFHPLAGLYRELRSDAKSHLQKALDAPEGSPAQARHLEEAVFSEQSARDLYIWNVVARITR